MNRQVFRPSDENKKESGDWNKAGNNHGHIQTRERKSRCCSREYSERDLVCLAGRGSRLNRRAGLLKTPSPALIVKTLFSRHIYICTEVLRKYLSRLVSKGERAVFCLRAFVRIYSVRKSVYFALGNLNANRCPIPSCLCDSLFSRSRRHTALPVPLFFFFLFFPTLEGRSFYNVEKFERKTDTWTVRTDSPPRSNAFYSTWTRRKKLSPPALNCDLRYWKGMLPREDAAVSSGIDVFLPKIRGYLLIQTVI